MITEERLRSPHLRPPGSIPHMRIYFFSSRSARWRPLCAPVVELVDDESFCVSRGRLCALNATCLGCLFEAVKSITMKRMDCSHCRDVQCSYVFREITHVHLDAIASCGVHNHHSKQSLMHASSLLSGRS